MVAGAAPRRSSGNSITTLRERGVPSTGIRTCRRGSTKRRAEFPERSRHWPRHRACSRPSSVTSTRADPVALRHSALPYYFRCLLDLGDDRVRRRLRIARLHDRPADHQIIGAGGDRLGRRHDALLVAGGAARRADARRHQRHAGPDDAAQIGRFLRRTDQPVDADVARLRGARGGQFADAHVVAGGGEIGVVIGGQHGHRENAQLRAALALDRRLHGLRIGVHGEKGRAELRHALDALGHRVADVVQLEIEKHLLAGRDQAGGERQAAGESELIADLVERHRRRRAATPWPRRPPPTAGRERRSVVRARPMARASSSHHQPRHIHQPRELRAQQIGGAGIDQYCPCRRRPGRRCGIATCSGITSAPQPSSSICRSAISERRPPARAGRGRRDREHAALEGGIGRIAAFAHARHPVDGVLQQRRDRGAVFRDWR